MSNTKLNLNSHIKTHTHSDTHSFLHGLCVCVCVRVCTSCVFSLHSATNKCFVVQRLVLLLLAHVSLFRLNCACGCWCTSCARVCVHVCTLVHVWVGKKRKKKKEGSGFYPMMQLFPPSSSSFFSKLVASGNTLIMRSDGHPIIFTSQTSKQQRARRVGTESKCQRLNQQQDKMAAT